MPVKLTRRELWALGLTAMVAAVSLGIAHCYFSRAFPEAGIRFELSRGQAAQKAQAVLDSLGLQPRGYRQATRFTYDDRTKTFIERELGNARAGKLLSGPLHLWRWQTRWFRPLSAEEMWVSLTPEGQLVGFRHLLPDEAAGARLAPAAARQVALDFLRRRMGLHPSQLRFIGMLRQDHPHRSDTTFTWAARWQLAPGSPNRDLERASYRYRVTVAGDRIGAYREFLKVPREWRRRYARLRARNDTTAEIADLFLLMLVAAMLVILIQRLRRGDVRRRPAIWIGSAGAVLACFAQLNSLPTSFFHYDTTQSWMAFLILQVLQAAGAGLAVGAFLALLTAGAEPLYRQRFPQHLFLGSYLSRRGFRTKPFFWSLALGLALACFFFAYQTVFYLIANHFGAWAPADVPYSSLLNTSFPWIFVMLIGFWPAIFEEFTFRMLAIPLIGRWLGEWRPGKTGPVRWRLGRLWLAVLAAAFMWGFAHANYPNQPFYIRGLEVGLGGVLLGWFMIRFGILTTVVWHYTVDAVYTAMLLLRAHNAYLRISGSMAALFAVLPLAIALGAYWRHGGFEPETGLRNADAGVAPAAPAAAPETPAVLPAYAPVPRRRWWWGAAIAAFLLTGYFLSVPHWPASRFRASPAQARAKAGAFLHQQGISTRGYVSDLVALPAWSRHAEDWSSAMRAIFRRQGLAAAQRESARWGPQLGWQARFFKPLQTEQFWVWMDPAASRVTGYRRQMRDRAPGASLSPAQAQARVLSWLAGQGIETRAMRAIRRQAKQRTARRDYDFAWQARLPGAAPAEARLTAQLLGSEIGGFARYLRLPQAESRRQQAWTAPKLLSLILKVAAGLAFSAWLIWLFVRAVRGRGWPGEAAGAPLRWKPLLLAGAAAAAIAVISGVNHLNRLLAQYPTTLPWAAWQIEVLISLLVMAAMSFFMTAALLVPLSVAAPRAFAVCSRAAWRSWGRDAALACLLGMCWITGWGQWLAWLNAHAHRWGTLSLPSAPGVDGRLPGIGSLLDSPIHAVWGAALAGTLAASMYWLWRRGRRAWTAGALALAWAVLWPQTNNWMALGLAALVSLAGLFLLLVLLAGFLRDNCLAYYSLALTAAWWAAGWSFWREPLLRSRLAGGILLAAAAGWVLALWLLGGSRRQLEMSSALAASPAPGLRARPAPQR